MSKNRITCPDSGIPRAERINQIVNCFGAWLTSAAFISLVESFGGDIPKGITTISLLKWLKASFIDTWDYRKRQKQAYTSSGEAARWMLDNSVINNAKTDLIYSASKELGLIGTDKSSLSSPDYILPLGGARMSNLSRCKLAKSAADISRSSTLIVALSSMRPIDESERVGFIDTYAPTALTEYDAICSGLSRCFELGADFDEETIENENPNMSHAIRKYVTAEQPHREIYALAAPSANPSRRADSEDCFSFFFNTFDIKEHSRILNCTSQIYCTYQQVRSLSFAIDYSVNFDTIGTPYSESLSPTEKQATSLYAAPVNYLQEIKATVDAMYDFVQKYALS